MPIDSEEDMHALIRRVGENAEEVSCGTGGYLRWSSEQGAELWLQFDENKALAGITPYFNGTSEMRVGVVHAVERPDDTPYEGAVYGWADPPGNDAQDGAYPFVFDLVDKAVYGELHFPFISRVRLAAFAHELSLFDSEESFEASQEGELRFASESFIPSGLFHPDGAEIDPPGAYAFFTGHILAANQLVNPLADGRYAWMRVRTLGGEIDIASDIESIETMPVVGGIASGSFWLCGRILDPKIAKKPGFLGRLFNR